MCNVKFEIEDLDGMSFETLSYSTEEEAFIFHLNEGSIKASCLWRVISNNQIIGTSKDVDFQHWMNKFASPDSVLSEYLFGKPIVNAYATEEIGDLFIEVEGNVRLELIKDHSALEVWEVHTGKGTNLFPDAWGTINGWKASDVKN